LIGGPTACWDYIANNRRLGKTPRWAIMKKKQTDCRLEYMPVSRML
jgi:hypothetical protein